MPTDNERIATALRYYLDRVGWAPGDSERTEFERLARFEVRGRKMGVPCDYEGCMKPATHKQIMGPNGSWNYCCDEHLETGLAESWRGPSGWHARAPAWWTTMNSTADVDLLYGLYVALTGEKIPHPFEGES